MTADKVAERKPSVCGFWLM